MQIATSILLGCELWNTSGVLAWTTLPRQRAPSLRGVRPSLSLSLGWAAVMRPKLSWRGRGHGVGQSLARSLGKEPACFPKKQWAGAQACALALAKLPVWALTFYTTSLPKFINLHWVCWTVWAKKGLEKVDARHSGISHMQRFDFSVWNVFLLKVLQFVFQMFK